MLLKNFDFAIKYYDLQSKIETKNSSALKVNGWYNFIDGILSALLVVDNNLYFLYGDDKFLITDGHRVMLERTSEVKGEFNLMDGSEVIVKFIYSFPDQKLNVTPFEYIDDEDFKWGEFIAKIINDRERKMNFISNLME